MSAAPPFERTVCACAECVACCKKQPVPLALGDFERIGDRLGEDVARSKLWRSPGAIVGKLVAGELSMFRIRTITPRADATGRCVFLGADDRCEIHDVSPYGCAFFDVHMERREGNRRADWYLRGINDNPEYARLRSTLEASPAALALEAEERS